MNSLLAAIISIPLFFASPAMTTGPSAAPAPAAVVSTSEPTVASYFQKSLRLPGSGAPDKEELARFQADELHAYERYIAAGGRADDPQFKEWFVRRTREFKVVDLGRVRDLTGQQFLTERLVERKADRMTADRAPLYFYDWYKARTGSPRVAEWMASATHQAFYDLPVFILWYSGFLRWFGALFAPLIEVPAGWFTTMSNKLWKRAASRGQAAVNTSLPNFTPPTLEEAGVAIRITPKSRIRNWRAWVPILTKLGFNQNSLGTHELRHGRDILTQNLHWRENQFSQLLSNYQAEANTFQTNFGMVKVLVMAYVPDILKKTVLDRIEDLGALYEMQWRNRKDKFLEPESIDARVDEITAQLLEDGVRSVDLDALKEFAEGLARAHAKIPVAIVSQTIQDELYLEHGSEEELRKMQEKFRVEYGMREIFTQYGNEAVRILSEMGQEADLVDEWNQIFLRLRSRENLADLRKRARTSTVAPPELTLDGPELDAHSARACKTALKDLPLAAE